MAKQLLLNILVETLGPFVEGLSIENLKLGEYASCSAQLSANLSVVR
jgi:hypothetical protein